MGIRDSYSGLKEKMKLKLRGKKEKPNDTGTGTDGGGGDPAIPLPQPVYVVADDSSDRGRGGPNTDGRPARSTDPLPRPAGPESTANDREGGEAGVDGEIDEGRSTLRQDDEVAVGSGSGQGGDSTSGETVERVPPILRYSREPDSE